MRLDDRQIELYSRQIILREVGGAGQRRLLEARCLLAGTGAALETAATYLAGAGVGAIDFWVIPTPPAPRGEALAGGGGVASPPGLAYAPLAERAPDTELRSVDVGAAGGDAYDVVLVASPDSHAAGVLDSGVTRVARDARRGSLRIAGTGAGSGEVVAVPAGGGAGCLACVAVASESGPRPSTAAGLPSRRGAGATAAAAVVAGSAGAMAAVIALRWLGAIAGDDRARAFRLDAQAPCWIELPVVRRPSCVLGCPP